MPLVTSNLIAHYKYDGSGQVLTDYSGEGNHGQLGSDAGADSSDPTWGPKGLSFDGSNDYVDLPLAAFAGEFTVTIVFRPTAEQNMTIVGGSTGLHSILWNAIIGATPNRYGVRVLAGGGADTAVASQAINNWAMVTVTRDASNKVDIYRNNSEATRLFSDAAQSGDALFDTLGRRLASTLPFLGEQAGALFYDRAITASENAENYAYWQTELAGRGIVFPPFVHDADTAEYIEATGATSHDVALPDNIAATNLLLGIFGGHSAFGPIAWEAGWNEILDEDGAAVLGVAWRKADGTEGETVNVTTDGNTRAIAYVLRITGAADPDVQPPVANTVVTGSSTAPNPGAAVLDGEKAYLAIAVAAIGASRTFSAYPANYAHSQNTNVTGSNSLAVASRQITASSEDPGAFTATSGPWAAATITIHPASSADVTTPQTQTAVSRIEKAVPQGQNSVSRIETVATAAQAALSRIAVSTPNTQTAISRVQDSVPRAQASASRIQAAAVRTQASVSSVVATSTTQKPQTAVSSIAVPASQTQAAVSRVQGQAQATQTAQSRTQKQATGVQPAVSRVSAAFTQAQGSVARVQAATPKTQGAASRVTASAVRTQTAISQIQITGVGTQTQGAVSRIQGTASATQSSVARVADDTATRTQTSTSRIQKTEQRTQTAVSEIQALGQQAQSAVSRVEAVAAQPQAAVSRIQTTAAGSQQGVSTIGIIGVGIQQQTSISRIYRPTPSARTRLVSPDDRGLLVKRRGVLTVGPRDTLVVK